MKYPAKVNIDYTVKASRPELLIRIVLGFVYCLIANIWAIFAFVAVVVQWFVILFTGRRHKALYDFIAGFWRYLTRVYSYVWMLTDERPPISGRA